MIPLIFAAAGAAVQTGGAIAKAIGGARRAKKAQEALENYQRQELTNAYRGKVGVSRLGADLQSQEMARMAASSMDALRSSGVRGLVGGIGRVHASNNLGQRQISADLDRQKRDIDRLAAQDDARIRDMRERREDGDIAGLGREINNGRQDLYGGIGDVGQAFSSLGGMMSMMDLPQGREAISSVAETAAGATSYTPQVEAVQAGALMPTYNNPQPFGISNRTLNYNAPAEFKNPMLLPAQRYS